jgi:hypothetical protein
MNPATEVLGEDSIIHAARTGKREAILRALTKGSAVEESIYRAARESFVEALTLAEWASSIDERFGVRLAGYALRQTYVEDEPLTILRCLDILSRTANCKLLRMPLSRLANHSNPQVRSKAMGMLARGQSAGWYRQHLARLEPRGRANAIESSFECLSPAMAMVYWKYIHDSDNRVAGNALLGMYKLDDCRAIPGIFSMAENPSARFQATSAWVMGQTADPRFLDALHELRKSDDGRVRMNAIRSIGLVRRAMESASVAGELACMQRGRRCVVDDWFEYTIEVTAQGGSSVRVPKTGFILREDNGIVRSLSVEESGAEYRLRCPRVKEHEPGVLTLQVVCESGHGQTTLSA